MINYETVPIVMFKDRGGIVCLCSYHQRHPPEWVKIGEQVGEVMEGLCYVCGVEQDAWYQPKGNYYESQSE